MCICMLIHHCLQRIRTMLSHKCPRTQKHTRSPSHFALFHFKPHAVLGLILLACYLRVCESVSVKGGEGEGAREREARREGGREHRSDELILKTIQISQVSVSVCHTTGCMWAPSHGTQSTCAKWTCAYRARQQ